MNSWLIILISVTYMVLLFVIASWAEKRRSLNKSVVNNPYVYTLTLAVYCTAWTYYGSVGNTANSGLNYLTIYLGPALMAPLWWFVLRKIIRISKVQKLTTLADFISSRYGKSITIGGLVTIFAVIGIIPYISLQLKAISVSFNVLTKHSPNVFSSDESVYLFYQDSAFYITLILIAFAIVYGTRNVDATKRNEGLVAAIAFESVFKLLAFLAIGLFVTFGVYNGFTDIFTEAAKNPDLKKLFTIDASQSSNWFYMIVLSMMAVMFLPRQFHVAVKENVNEKHLDKAIWLFPLYLLIINIFVLPIALGGSMMFAGSEVNADNYVLAIPIQLDQDFLAVLIYLGGFSASTSMVIVSTVALSVMVSNNLVLPILLRNKKYQENIEQRLAFYSVMVRRLGIATILILAMVYYNTLGKSLSLFSMGLISFVAVAQFAPAIIGGIYWKGGTKKGAITGLIFGFSVWAFTLISPILVAAQLLPQSLMDEGLWKLGFLKPYSLFGMETLSEISHSFFWSILLNLFAYIVVSLNTKQSAKETNQAEVFVDIFKYSQSVESSILWKGTAYVADIRRLLANILGSRQTIHLMADYGAQYNKNWKDTLVADPQLVTFAEKELTGAVGSASARLLVASVVKEEPISTEEVISILQEKQQLLTINKELEKKSEDLRQATKKLKQANAKLVKLDLQKDEFITTVAHELKTPLTSIRAFSEILSDNPDLGKDESKKFLDTITSETIRMTRLITQVLDLEMFQSGKHKILFELANLNQIIDDSVESMRPLIEKKGILLRLDKQQSLPPSMMDVDRIKRVIINLVSNAVKFCPAENGEVTITSYYIDRHIQVNVADNGPGIKKENQQVIFEPFFQADNQTTKKPIGSGLGLAISKRIIDIHKGKLWVESKPGHGARFSFEIPYNKNILR